jgi:YVTN family beta-propeller protein
MRALHNGRQTPAARRLYTANGGSDDVSIVDIERGVEVGRIRVGGRPWGVAVTP